MSTDAQAARYAPLEVPNIAPRNFANDRMVILNMHGLLFHDDLSDVQENVEYASWLNAGVIRVFSTDKIGHSNLSGGEVGERIAAMAPLLRQHNLKLIVAFMDQYLEIPGDNTSPMGWMHGYRQLQLPFYTVTWRGAYRQFLNEIVWTVKERGARDVIWAWEIGNEIHTQEEPERILTFVDEVSAEIKRADPYTPVLAGTMGGGVLEPGVPDSPVARDLFCEAPVHAYTLHTFDWWDKDHGGDVPIHWDLENVTNTACTNGRALPVIVEELGTSLELPGVYRADEPWKRLEIELRQIQNVLAYPSVTAIGVWSAESPHARWTRHDLYRGLTSHRNPDGTSGSCYRPLPGSRPGTRCELELALRNLPRLPDLAVVSQGYEASLRNAATEAHQPSVLVEQTPQY